MWLWLVLVSIWIPFSLTLLSKSSWLQIVRICCHPFFLNHLSQFELACYLGFNCFFFLLMCFAIHLGGFSFRVWVLCKCAQTCFPLLDKLNAFHAPENFAQQISRNSCGVWSNFWDLKFDEMCRQLSKRDAVVWNWSLITLLCAVMPDFWLDLLFHCFGTMALTSSIQSGIMTHGNGLAWQPVLLRYVLILLHPQSHHLFAN